MREIRGDEKRYILEKVSRYTLQENGQSLHCWHETHKIDGKIYRLEGSIGYLNFETTLYGEEEV